MRRITLLLFVAVLAFSSCNNNTEDNSPALQSQVDSLFFRAADVRAQANNDGSYTIQGVTATETMIIHLSESDLGQYPLGSGFPSFASFEDQAGNNYTTAPFGDGEVEITDRCISCGWLTGNFNFRAVQEGIDTITVQKGFFFEVSFLQGELPGGGGTVNDGIMVAELNMTPYNSNSVSAEKTGNSVTVTGFLDTDQITITFPADAVSGDYLLTTPGFSASYSDGTVTEEAITGLISVNFNNTNTGGAKLFFRFDTENNSVQEGDSTFNYL